MIALNLIVEHPLRRTVEFTGWLKRRPIRFALVARCVAAIDFCARGVFHVWRQHRYLTFYKLFNMALVNAQFKLKTEYVVGRPYKMKIEPTNICNTKCQLCPTGIGLEGRPKGKMEFPQYSRLIDRFKRHLMALDLSMWGDPLISPDIYKMIRYAHDRRIWTYISTNLHAYKLGRGQAEQLVESGLDMLTCSLHGATQETYEQYQPGKRLDDCIEKIREIIATRKRLGSATPQIQLNFVVTRHNEHEREAFTQLARELGCKPIFSAASMNVRFIGQDKNLVSLGLSEDLKKKQRREHVEHWAPKDKSFLIEPYQRILEGEDEQGQWNGKKLFDCEWPWRSTVVNWDGNVVTCCGSFDPAEDMGNALEQPFGRIWTGRKYRMARRSSHRRVEGGRRHE